MKHAAFILLFLAMLSASALAGAEEYLIKPGDNLSITVLGEPDLTKRVIVDQQGNVALPLIKDVPVANMTTAAAADELSKRMRKYVKNPQVVVELLQPGRMEVIVSGEVRSPGTYPISPGGRLMEAITAAGGYTPNADLTRVSISHRGGATSTTVDLSKFLVAGEVSANVSLLSGDTIVVPGQVTAVIGSVTVLGAVRQSGAQPLTPGMTVREAIMMAGGPTELADLAKVTLRREGSTEPQPVNYSSAAQGDAEADFRLKPGDVIYVAAKAQLGFYTVNGAVNAPGKYELKGPTTLTEAVAVAGGFKDKAKMDQVQILRSGSGTSQTLRANISAILSGKAQNITLQDQDSVYIPQGRQKPDMLSIISLAVSLGWLLTR